MTNIPTRQTLQTAHVKKAPMQIVMVILPVWLVSLVLSFAMPFTGIFFSLVAMLALFTLPFKAREGACPACGTKKLFPFSGFGGICKGCGHELVLRDNMIHLLEEKPKRARTGSGRSNR